MKQKNDSQLDIQRLETNEWERLREIRLKALKEAPDAFGSTFEETATRPTASWIEQTNTLPTFVAVHRGLDSGIVRCAPHSEKESVADLISMWVAPSARGIGAGSALIDAVIDWARSEGYAQLLLDVDDSNNFATALYERKGFKSTGVTSCFPPPRQHIKEHEMALDL